MVAPLEPSSARASVEDAALPDNLEAAPVQHAGQPFANMAWSSTMRRLSSRPSKFPPKILAYQYCASTTKQEPDGLRLIAQVLRHSCAARRRET